MIDDAVMNESNTTEPDPGRSSMAAIDSDEMVDQLNQSFAGRYVIEGELGRGGMAIVYLARQRHPNRQVAIKVLDPNVTSHLQRDRFLREVAIVANLSHPHIVPIFDAGEVGGMLYYVMPHIDGESLRVRLIRERSLPLSDAIHIVRDVAEALEYAHRAEVVHRDIKPGNILLSSGAALVTDFGIAGGLCAACGDRLSLPGEQVGTPGYMSPEQAMGMGDVDRRSDIYSLASVLYEMLLGELPSLGSTWGTAPATQRHKTSAVQRLRNSVPDAVVGALRRALDWDPAARFATAAEFVDALGADYQVLAPQWMRLAETSGLEPTPPASIAVLPFRNVSSDPANESLSDGITDNLISLLSTTHGFQVASRRVVTRHQDTAKSLREIGQALGVANVLEGSVRRAGDAFRIVSRLIDVETDAQLWAETYDGTLTGVAQTQRRVTEEIAAAVRTAIGTKL